MSFLSDVNYTIIINEDKTDRYWIIQFYKRRRSIID